MRSIHRSSIAGMHRAPTSSPTFLPPRSFFSLLSSLLVLLSFFTLKLLPLATHSRPPPPPPPRPITPIPASSSTPPRPTKKNLPRLGFPRATASPAPADATSRWFRSWIRRRRRKEGAGGSVHARRTGIRCPSTTRPCRATSIASRGHVLKGAQVMMNVETISQTLKSLRMKRRPEWAL